MNRVAMFIVFITIVSLIYFGLHLFVYKFLTKSLELSGSVKKILKLFFWFSGLSFFISILLSRVFQIYFLNYYANIWLGIIAIAFFVLFITWVTVRFVPSRTRLITLIALSIIGFISLYSLVNGFQKPVVREITIPIKTLSKELSGFTIVQLSDLHMEIYKSKNRIPYIVETVNVLKPDLIVFTGDLIEGDICDNQEFCDHLKRLKAAFGMVAITGNHEFYAGIEDFLELAKKTNIRVLRNEILTVADSIQIIGLDDDEARRFGFKGPDLDTAIKGCDPSKPMILLYHRPVNFDQAIQTGVDLQLSGHTHAGQIPPMDLIVWLYYKYSAGLYKKNDSFIYTSMGTGYWGPPMRFLSRSEIVKITLVSN